MHIRQVGDGRQRPVSVAKAYLHLVGTTRRHRHDLHRIASDPPTHGVHEMATFTHEARAFEFGVSIPAVRREPSCVDQVPGVRRLGRSPEPFPHLHQERGESPVESDHDLVVAGGVHSGENAVELVRCQGQRLFDEDGFSRLEGAARQVGMGTVPSDDEHSVDRRVLEDGFRCRFRHPQNRTCAAR